MLAVGDRVRLDDGRQGVITNIFAKRISAMVRLDGTGVSEVLIRLDKLTRQEKPSPEPRLIYPPSVYTTRMDANARREAHERAHAAYLRLQEVGEVIAQAQQAIRDELGGDLREPQQRPATPSL